MVRNQVNYKLNCYLEIFSNMIYDAVKNNHGLPHDPFKALVSPRPIGWITSMDQNGVVNLAPYSYFNAVSDRPHYVMFSSMHRKDSLRNIEQTGEFTCSLATWDTRNAMNITSAPLASDRSEYEQTNLTMAPSQFVAPPRVAQSPAALECRHWKTISLPDLDTDSDPDLGHFVVFGQVIGIYIDDSVIRDGLVDAAAMQPLARLGYMNYSVVREDNMFSMVRPHLDENGDVIKEQPEEWDGVYR
ncbi:MAG: flavin reductase (DIM6/NTAB) family NADH-FMN oxidoreductase RutF [Parasphingorhabdus sp.]|jgi:flavin reductase (DIM6/NTAB) family NADH-FMN oxidoreductase RutF